MNKYKALAITGQLEIQLQGHEDHLAEVTKLQKCIAEDNFISGAIYFGRLSELCKNFDPNVTKNLDFLSTYVIASVNEKEDQPLFDLPIEELDLTVRSYNCLKRAGIHTIGDILHISKSVLCDRTTIRNLGIKSAQEIIERVENMGFKMKE